MKQNLLLSEKLHVFPFGTNRPSDPLGRVINETNLTNLVKKLTDYSSYVVAEPTFVTSDDGITSLKMEFIIEGYYFSADVADLLQDEKPLYAYIDLSRAGSYTYLLGNDIIGTAEGEGTSVSPKILTEGELSLKITRTETYFKHTFESADQTIVIKSLSDMIVETSANVEGSTNQVTITSTAAGEEVRFSIKSSSAQEADVYMIVVTPNVFTGLKFSYEQPEVINDRYCLQLLDEAHAVPKVSLSRFSADSVSLNVDVINCGNASTVITPIN